MRLFIAEKPSLGRAIADVLPKPQQKGEGFIRAGNGDVVSWCFGHLLELAEPDQYDPAFKQWNLQHLPIIPDQWQLQPKPKTRKQISVLRKLCKEAEQIVHCGDPDREGQLLVDELIQYLKLPERKRAQVLRCLINDLNPSAVKSSLEQLKENRDFIPLSTSALARSRADWLYGINMTRACTLHGRGAGYNGVLSVGRVQTPVLGLVVRRDLEIESFTPRPFYEVLAQLETEQQESLTVKWQPSEACRKWQDEEGRVLYRPLAENVAARVKGKTGRVERIKQQQKQLPAPLPYNLSALQIDASKRYSLSAQQVLDSCQSLYEKHKLITYPRSDCRYLPVGHLAEAPAVTNAILSNCPRYGEWQEGYQLSHKGRAWNDKKVGAHHAIIPTRRTLDMARLSQSERQVYELIARQYLIQFMSPHRYSDTRLEVLIEGGLFKASARQVIDQGWKLLLGKTETETEQECELPPLKEGDLLSCIQADVVDKMTQPPKPFTEASLLAAMTGIGRFVEDPEIRKVLKDTDGLGTEATRAGIIELLFKRQFLQRQGKNVCSTDAGRALINSLPDRVSKPDMTAQWESSLEAISKKEQNYQSFMLPLQQELDELIRQAEAMDKTLLARLPQQSKPVRGRKKTTSRKRKPRKKVS